MDWAAQQTGGVASVRERPVEVAVREWRLQLSRDSVYSESGGPPKGNCGEGNAAGNSVDAGCLKEASFRRNCWEGNRPQSLEVASLLKLVAGNVLFSAFGSEGLDFAGRAMPAVDRPPDSPARNFFCQ